MSAPGAKSAHEAAKAFSGGESLGAQDDVAAVGSRCGDEHDAGHALRVTERSEGRLTPVSREHMLPPHTHERSAVAGIEAHITGTVWKIEVGIGDTIEEGDTVVILESMKMEMPVEAEDEGTVKEILVEEGQAVSEGDTLVVLE
jgi:acetyl-CoA carboxylase biotin carboxyl carrier protein